MLEFIVYGGIAVVGLAAYSSFGTYNRLMALDERCNTAFGDIDALLKHRSTLIPSIVETVKGYVAEERHALDSVMQARMAAIGATSADMRATAEHQVGVTLQNLVSMSDKYPQLTTSPHFTALRNELTDIDNRITAARRFFNLSVDEYNATLRQYPGKTIGQAMRLTRRQQYNVGAERILLDEGVQFSFA